jgi:DHA1 family tetracycline resistance protein-like MFS transporter
MIIFFLPESLPAERRGAALGQSRPPFTYNALKEALKRPKVGPLLQVRFFFALAFATFQSIFALYAQSIGLSSQTTGILLAYVGVLAVVTQAGLIGFLTRRFRENTLMITGLWVMTGALLAWAFTSQLWFLVVLILPLAMAGGVSNTIIQSATTKSVPRLEVGGILGITTSLEAVTRVIAPIAGGYLLQHLGVWAPGIFSVLLMALTIVIAYRRIILPTNRENVVEETV